MTPERWQQVREVLHGAMQVPVAERSAFLDSKCSDLALRGEVESFLAAEKDLLADFLETPVRPSFSYEPGTRLGPYEILAFIGAGGMGEVYEARDTRLERTVALKVIPRWLSSDPERRRRFALEARAISMLQHPNICTLYDVGSQDGSDYLVMELLEGETLASRVLRERLQHKLTLSYAVEIADALECAHKYGIVHRDLKPGNVFLTRHGISKVLDFGLAKLIDPQNAAPSSRVLEKWHPVLTMSGVAMGTVAYMSPEQARGEEVDERTDIFSLGAVLYEMATGKMAFPGKTPAIVFKAILDETPPLPSKVDCSLPRELDQIVEKALQKNRDCRYQTVSEMRQDLALLTTHPAPFEASALQSTRRSPRHGVVISLTIASILAVLLFVSRIDSLRTHATKAVLKSESVQTVLIEKIGASDPIDEGFRIYTPLTDMKPAMHNRRNNGWDRWRLVTDYQNYYYHPMSDAEKDFALGRDWKLTCVCAVEEGLAFADADFGVDGGAPRYDITLMKEGNRYFVALITQIAPELRWHSKIEFSGAGDIDSPHTYELRYDHVSKTASLWIDGEQRSSGYRGMEQYRKNLGLDFGAALYLSSRVGIGVYRHVRFEAH